MTALPPAMVALSWVPAVGTALQLQLPALPQSPVLGVQVQDNAMASCVGDTPSAIRAARAIALRLAFIFLT